MPTSDPMEILLRHDKWATGQIIDACEKLTPAQFAQKFDLGPGSLQATLTHMVSAMNTWSDTLARRPHRPRADASGIAYTPAQLRAMFEDATADFTTLARNHPVAETVTRAREGKDYAFARGAVITHVATHGVHHRAQCLNMLKHLGVKPLPLSSVAEWTRVGDVEK